MNAVAAAPVPRDMPAIAIEQIPVDLVDVGTNVRIDPGELEEMASSIAELGVLQPVKVVGPHADGRYRLVWGQRRLLASKQAGKATIPAWVVAEADVDEPGPRRSIEQLAENLQRADLNPIDEARAIREVLAGDDQLTQADLAKRLGVSAPWISNTLALLEAAEPVQQLVADSKLTPSHVKAIRGLAPKTQAEFAKKAVDDGWSAHRLEVGVQDYKRQEEWRKEQEAQNAKERKAKVERMAAGVARLEQKKVPLDAEIRVIGYYDKDAAAEAIRKAGFTNVTTAKQIQTKPSGVACDCTTWKVEPSWDGKLTVVPGCVKDAHQQLKTKADDQRRQEKNAAETRTHKRLAELVPTQVKASAFGDARIHMTPLVGRMTLWHALDYRLGDWSVAHGGKSAKPWDTILQLSEEQLAEEIGKALATSFRDRYGYRVPWEALEAAIGAAPAPEPSPKPARAKKAKA